jgi:hypothetical protein
MSLARYLSKLGALLNSNGQIPAGALATGAVTQSKIAHIVSGTLSRNNDVSIPINSAYPISIVTFSGRHTTGGTATC